MNLGSMQCLSNYSPFSELSLNAVFETVKLFLHYLFAFYTTLIILDWITYNVIRISIFRIWLCVRFANLLVIYALNFHDRLHISISHYLPHFVLEMKHRFQKYWNWALLFWPSLSNMIGGWIMFGLHTFWAKPLVSGFIPKVVFSSRHFQKRAISKLKRIGDRPCGSKAPVKL